MTTDMTRRGFLAGTGALAATAGVAAETKTAAASPADPFLGTHGAPFSVGLPNLQAPGETTMGVSSRGQPDASLFPTVVEGKVENGRLRILVHDVLNGRVVLDREIA